MFKILRFLFLLGVIVLFLPNQTFAKTNSFVGKIVDTHGQPVADVAVYSEQTGELYMSDALGEFVVNEVTYPINLTPLTQEVAFSPAMLSVTDETVDVSFTGTLLSPESFDCQVVVTVRQADCEALLSIYEMMDGEAWKYNDRWLRHRNVCRWWGVACASETGEVTMLHLSFNNLSGALPPEISNLTGLRGLHLAHNNVTSLPDSVGSLTQLIQLDVRDNRALDSLPPSVWELPYLTSLHINGNTQLNTVFPSGSSVEYVDHNYTEVCASDDAMLMSWIESVIFVPNQVQSCSSPFNLLPAPLSVMVADSLIRQQNSPIFWFAGYIVLLSVLSAVYLKFGRQT